jgi:polyisoprenoid-binding protein YceI
MTSPRPWRAAAGLAVIPAACLLLVASAQAATWKLDPARSTLGFTAEQTGAAFHGRFSSYSAAIDFDPAHPEKAHILVIVDLASAATGDRQRDTALPGSDWFDTARFPKARFEATSVRRKGPNAYEAVGALVLRGVSRPVVLPFTLDISGAAAHAKGHLDLARTAFGVGQGAWASGQWVGLNVGVDIDVTATRAG